MINQYIGPFVCWLSIFVEFLALWNVKIGFSSRNWKSIKGRIFSSCVTVTQITNNEGPSVTYKPRIQYGYEYEGKNYTGSKIGYLIAYTGKADAEKLTRKFQEGTVVDIYIDPQKPSRCVLIRGVSFFRAACAIGFPFFMYFIGRLLIQKFKTGA